MCGAAWFRWSLEEATLFQAGIEIFMALYFFLSICIISCHVLDCPS